MSGTAALVNQLANPTSANPAYWGQQMNNLNALKDFAGDTATQRIMQQPGVVDPTTGQVNQGSFNALVSADPDASWKAAQRMQAQGQAQGAQADAQNQTVAGHLAQLKIMNGEMSDLLQSGQPITSDQVQTRLSSLGKEGILTPAVMSGIAADLNSQPPGADLTGWLRNHMATNLSASEQLQNVSSQPYHYDAGGYIGVGEGNPNRAGYMAPGTQIGKTLTPEAATDIATIQFPDNTTRQVPRGQVPAILGGTPGAKEVPSYEGTIQAHEGLTADATNPTTVGGFRPSTWMSFAAANPSLFAGMTQQQIMAARSDPALNRQGVTWLAQQNAGQLSKSGVKPSGPALGVAHYVGAGAAASIMQAPDNAPVADFVDPAALQANPELRTMTVGQMKQRYAGVPDPAFLGGGGGGQPPAPYRVTSNAPVAPPTSAAPPGDDTFFPAAPSPPAVHTSPTLRGPGSPVPPAQPAAATPAAPVVAPPAPAVTPQAPPMRPGFSAPAGYGQSVEADQKAYQADAGLVARHQDNINGLNKAYQALQIANTGPSTERVHNALAWLQAQGVPLPGGMDERTVAWAEAKKYLTAYALQAGGGVSDAHDALSQAANASTDIPQQAALAVVRNNIARERMAIAQFQEAPNKTGLGYINHTGSFTPSQDLNAYQADLVPPEQLQQIQKMKTSDPAAFKRFSDSLDIAVHHGLISRAALQRQAQALQGQGANP